MFSRYLQAGSQCSFSPSSGSSKPTFFCQKKQGLKGTLCVEEGGLAHCPRCLLVAVWFRPLNFRFLRCKMDMLLYLPHGTVVSITWKECVEEWRAVFYMPGGTTTVPSARGSMPDTVGQTGSHILKDRPGQWPYGLRQPWKEAPAARASLSSRGK